MQGRKSGSSIENLDIDRDVLGSLEKLHTSMSGTLGTMRSIRSNGSIPTLERVRREESNHSIGSHSQTSSGQVDNDDDDGDAATDVDDDNEQAQYWFSQTSSGKLTRILGNFGIGNIYKKLISQVCRSMLIGEGYLNEFIALCVEIEQLKQQRSFDEL